MKAQSRVSVTSTERPHRARGLALVAAAIVAVLQAGPAVAADYLIHDRYGRRIGTVEQIDRDILVVHDRYGRRIGTLTPSPSGGAAIEDRFGRKIGTVDPKGSEPAKRR